MNNFFQPPQNDNNTAGGNVPASGSIFGNQPGGAAGAGTSASTNIFGKPSTVGSGYIVLQLIPIT